MREIQYESKMPKEWQAKKKRKWTDLKKILPKYNMSQDLKDVMCCAYYGDGIRMIHESDHLNLKQEYLEIDKNASYPATLMSKVYPLSGEVSIRQCDIYAEKNVRKEASTGLKVFFVKFAIKKKAKEFEKMQYDNYLNEFEHISINGVSSLQGWVTNVDLRVIMKLYELKFCWIEEIIEFKTVGKIAGIEHFVKTTFKWRNSFEKGTEEREYAKRIVESIFYGKMAQKKQKAKRGYKVAERSEYLPIAMFEIAYMREEIVDKAIEFKKWLSYICTDGIILRKGAKVEDSQEIGEYKVEFINKHIIFIRHNFYFVLDKKGNIIEQVVSGVNGEIPIEDVKRLYRGEEVEVKSWERDTKSGKYEWKVKRFFKDNNNLINMYKIKKGE